jgi:c-di-GMP-binding flagellar brake protein YcgR
MEVDEKADRAALGQSQRRAYPRYAVEGDCTLLLVGHGFSSPCSIVDLGLGGCRIHVRDRLPAGAGVRVEITFKVNGVAFRFSGVTRWTDGRHLAGIQFLEMSPRRREELVEVIAEVETAAAIEAQKKAAKEPAAEAGTAREVQPKPKPSSTALTEQPQNSRPSPTVQQMPDLPPSAESAWPRLSFVAQSGPRRPANPPANAQTMPAASLLSGAKPFPAQPQPAPSPAPASQKGPAPVTQERRSQMRHQVDTSVKIFLVRGGGMLTGRILDLSLNGCRIRTDERFPLGIYTRVETEFRLEGLPFRLGGVVQAIHGPFAVGVRFLDLSERKREQVAGLIEEIEQMHSSHAQESAKPDKESGAPGAVQHNG